MDRKELDRLAYMGAPLPELDYADTLYFLCKRGLYQFYKNGGELSAEEGKAEAAKIDKAVARYSADVKMSYYHAEILKRVEFAATDYCKADTKEKALVAASRIIEALDGMPPPEKWKGGDNAEQVD